MTSNILIAQIFSGVAYGSIYGLYALGIVFLYRANKLFNLAITELATFFTIMMAMLLTRFSYAVAFLIVIISAFIGGTLLHVFIMRVVTERKNVLHSNETVITVGLYTILNALSCYLFSDEPESFPFPFPNKLINIMDTNVSSHSFIILIVSGMLVAALLIFLRLTKLGLLLEATSQHNTNARLRGVKTSNMLALAWGFTTATAVVAGVLIAPILFVSPFMLSRVFAYALIAVIIGGLESPFGAVLGGILIGVVENLSTNISFVGSDLKFVAVFCFLILVLLVRPRGLWGREEHRRV